MNEWLDDVNDCDKIVVLVLHIYQIVNNLSRKETQHGKGLHTFHEKRDQTNNDLITESLAVNSEC